MKNIYKALKDFGVTDDSSPIYGSHVAGSEIDVTEEVAAPLVADGSIELVQAGDGTIQDEQKVEKVEDEEKPVEQKLYKFLVDFGEEKAGNTILLPNTGWSGTDVIDRLADGSIEEVAAE